MNRYLVLDLYNKEDALYFADKFLKDSKQWKAELKKAEADLESVTNLSAINNSEVHTGNISHPTENMAFDRMRIEISIERLNGYKSILYAGLVNLDDRQKKIINAFYFTSGRYISSLVYDLADEFGCSPRSIYHKKNTALLDFVSNIMVYINY